MKYILPILCMASATAWAQAPQEPPQRTREEMEAINAKQKAQVEKLSAEFFELNEQIEGKIDSVVNALAALEDSKATKTRISRMKGRVIEDLKSSIAQLRRQRSANAALLARVPTENRGETSQAKANEILDAKLKARVDQVMTLSSSLYESREVQKYEYYVKDSYNGDGLDLKRKRSDEYKLNQKQTTRASMQREDLIRNIEEEQKRVDQKISHLKSEVQRAGLSEPPPEQAAHLEQLESFKEILAEKKKEVLMGGKTVATSPVGDTRQAMELERQLEQAVQELRVANNELRQKGNLLKQHFDRMKAQDAVLEKTPQE